MVVLEEAAGVTGFGSALGYVIGSVYDRVNIE